MPILFGYKKNAFNTSSGNNDLPLGVGLQLKNNLSTEKNQLYFDVTEASGSASSQTFNGDENADETGNDSGQSAVITRVQNGKSHVEGEGQVYLESAHTITGSNGDVITLYRVEIGGNLEGWVTDGELLSWVSYTVTDVVEITDANAPSYADINGPADQIEFATNVFGGLTDDVIDGGDENDSITGGDGNDTVMGGGGNDRIIGDGEGLITKTIDASNYSDTTDGFTVTAANVSGGFQTSASASNVVTSGMGFFGASGTVSDSDSGVTEQIGFDKASGLSEQFIVEFDESTSVVSFDFEHLYTASFGEIGHWAIYNAGVLVAEADFTEDGFGSGSGTVGISGYGEFDKFVLTAKLQSDGSDGSDFGLTGIQFEAFGPEGAGNDSIEGGAGDDTLIGGAGDDTLKGGLGDDYIDGGIGDDFLTTGLGNDTLVGGEGDDTLHNSAGDDSLVGGVGNDSIVATAGNDTLEGGDGNDTLDGGSEDDSIYGGTGDDIIYTGLGTDKAFGDDDQDTFHVNGAEGIEFNQSGTNGVASASGMSDFPTTALSFEIQFSSDGSGPTNPTFASYAVAGEDDEFLLYANPTDKLVVSIGGNTLDTGTSIAGLFDGMPHSLALTWDSATGALEIYADGASIYSGTLATGDTLTQGGKFVFGQEQDSVGGGYEADQRFQGEIHNAKLFDDVRTPAEVASDAGDHEADTSDSALVAGWIPDADTGALRDLTGNHTMVMSGDTEIITGLGGNDVLYGGEGGTDFDTVDLSTLTTGVTVTFKGDESGEITDGTDTISFSEIEKLILTDQADVVIGADDSVGIDIDGGAGKDTLTGGTGADSLSGGSGDDNLGGGVGDDTLVGGSGNDTFNYSPGDGHDTISDFNTGNTGTLSDGNSANNDFLDLSTYYDNLSELYADQADDGILNQSNALDAKGRATDYTDNTQFGVGSLKVTGAMAGNSSYTQENTGVVCFTSGTAIRTPTGDRLIDELKVGDLVVTMDNGPQKIRWIGRRNIGPKALAADVRLRPVLIPKGIIGAERNLLVSRQHALLVNRDELARAVHLTQNPGLSVRIAHGQRQVNYIHLMFDTHQIIFAENVAAESFYPGKMAIKMLDPDAREEMLLMFPNLGATYFHADCQKSYGETVRPIADINVIRMRSLSFDRIDQTMGLPARQAHFLAG